MTRQSVLFTLGLLAAAAALALSALAEEEDRPQGGHQEAATPWSEGGMPLYAPDPLAGVWLPSMEPITWEQYARLLWEATRGRWDPVVK